MQIRLTKEFNFESAHALQNYDGKCKNMHGHSYKLFVTIIGEPINDSTDPKNGMVMDFGILKKIVDDEITNSYDHSVLLNKNDPKAKDLRNYSYFSNFKLTDYQPTCENLLIEFAQKIKTKLPQNVKLHSLKLHETATSYAEWFADDQ